MRIKGRWATQMPVKIGQLQHSLCAMLAAINCLVSLACYHKTGYDARCSVELYPRIRSPIGRWKNIRTAGNIYGPYRHRGASEEFKQQNDPVSFFRPGQIFTAQITSCLLLKNKRTFRKVDFENFPLEPIPKLQAIAEKEQLEDMSKRLAQIRNLPLDRMTRYCKDIPGDRKSVQCLLCEHGHEDSRILKDYWASQHFRARHKLYYFGMLPIKLSQRQKTIPWEEQLEKLPRPTRTEFSPEEWILLEDITSDIPIPPDESFEFWNHSERNPSYGGPIMIQRFVVVREDRERCLCLGIHTYAKQGCGNQSDQELHGVLSSSKTPPPLKHNETKISLSPVRMKPDHPSLALSSTARIHYGRAYEIDHRVPVQPLSLIHSASMEVLLNQFEANVARLQPGEDLKDEWEKAKLDNVDLQQRVEDVTPSIEAAYTSMNIVKDMRKSMERVLGPKFELPKDYYNTNQ
ncbi:hypothetical protein J3F84DRAFT_369027 [Trichoderma pleuroticola]